MFGFVLFGVISPWLGRLPPTLCVDHLNYKLQIRGVVIAGSRRAMGVVRVNPPCETQHPPQVAVSL